MNYMCLGREKTKKKYEDITQREKPDSCVEYIYRKQYYEVIDFDIASLHEYFSSTDILKYQSYCDILLKGSNPPPDFLKTMVNILNH